MAPIRFQTTADPSREEIEAIDAGLTSFNRAAAKLDEVRPIACIARCAAGKIIGGAIARTWGACCELQQLWVDEAHRGNGVGSQLVRLVEAEALHRGCSMVYLETFSFQAPEFYRCLDYKPACELTGFPDGVTKYVLQKSLTPA